MRYALLRRVEMRFALLRRVLSPLRYESDPVGSSGEGLRSVEKC